MHTCPMFDGPKPHVGGPILPPGGIPVLYEGECIGGVGVSGIDKDDEPVAEAGAAAFSP